MKNTVILLGFITLLFSMLLLTMIRLAQAEVTISQNSPCDFHKASKEFALFMQAELKNNPQDFYIINKDFQELANEIMQLAQEGKHEEICVKYTQFKRKF